MIHACGNYSKRVHLRLTDGRFLRCVNRTKTGPRRISGLLHGCYRTNTRAEEDLERQKGNQSQK